MSLPEPSDSIKKIGQHFILFVQKLDSFLEVESIKEGGLLSGLGEEQQEDIAFVYIQSLGNFLIQSLDQKYRQISALGGISANFKVQGDSESLQLSFSPGSG